MNKKKLIIIIFVIVVISVLLFFIFKMKFNIVNLDNSDTELRVEDIYNINQENKKIQRLNSYVELNTVKNCIQKFYSNYFSTNISDYSDEQKNNYKEIVYNMLSKEYIEKNNILKQNIISMYENVKECSIEIYNVYTLSQYINDMKEYGTLRVYFVSGIVRNKNTLEGKDFNMIITLDNNNNAFEVCMEDYIEYAKFNNLEVGEEVDFHIPEVVENRKDNVFYTYNATFEDIVRERFNNIRNLLTKDIEKAYSMLNSYEEFINIQEFKEFVEENKRYIYLMSYNTYSLKYEGDNFIIECYDKKDRYCISIYCNSYTSYKFSIAEL